MRPPPGPGLWDTREKKLALFVRATEEALFPGKIGTCGNRKAWIKFLVVTVTSELECYRN